MKIRRCLAYDVEHASVEVDGDGVVTSVVRERSHVVTLDADETATPHLTADRLVEEPWRVVHAEWVEMPGQESLLP